MVRSGKTIKFEQKNIFELSAPSERAHCKLQENVLNCQNWIFQTEVMANEM